MSKKQRNGTNVASGQGFQPGNLLPRRRSEADKFITQQLIACLRETRTLDDGTKKERVAIACDAIVSKMERGDLDAAEFVVNRVEGKLTERRVVDGTMDVNHHYDMSRLTQQERAKFAELGRKSLVIEGVATEVPGDSA